MNIPATLILALGLMAVLPARAHDFKAGDVVIDHPYATPTVPGARTGAVYFRGLKNGGTQADRLVSARTPAAASVEIHQMNLDSTGVMRMRALDALDLPPGAEAKTRHGGEIHLMLHELKAPLAVGDRFPLTLRFERGGEREVKVWVQQPRDVGAADPHQHHH